MDVCGAQNIQSDGCKTTGKFAPDIVSNPSATVAFKCTRAAPLDLIRATGRQTRIRIGLVFGLDPSMLEKPQRSNDLAGVTARNALTEAIRDTGYSLREEDGVLVLIAGDLTPRQASYSISNTRNFRLVARWL